jgi:hypothetical protein
MTTLVTQPQLKRSESTVSSMLASLETAVSDDTKVIGRRVDALRIQPSPASLPASQVVEGKDISLSERLFDALAAVKIMTAQVAMHLDQTFREGLFRQLDSLHDTEEWEDSDEPLSQSSFQTFLKAVLSIKPERRPGLGLSNTGNLIAAWTTAPDRLTIEFLPNDQVRWVLSRYYNDEPVRIAGQMGVSRLVEELAPYKPARWFCRESKSDTSPGR